MGHRPFDSGLLLRALKLRCLLVHHHVVHPPGERRRVVVVPPRDRHRHHVQADQPVDLVRGDVERPAVAEIELDAAVRAGELLVALVDRLDMRIVRELAVGQRCLQRAGHALFYPLRLHDSWREAGTARFPRRRGLVRCWPAAPESPRPDAAVSGCCATSNAEPIQMATAVDTKGRMTRSCLTQRRGV